MKYILHPFIFCLLFILKFNLYANCPLDEQFKACVDHDPNCFKSFPKGAELHTHLAGAITPETLLRIAKNHHYCIDPKNFTVSQQQACTDLFQLSQLKKSDPLYEKIIEEWSMQGFDYSKSLGHDHFFDAFGKFMSLISSHRLEAMVSMIKEAYQQNILYLEIILDNTLSLASLNSLQYSPDFSAMQKTLINEHFLDQVQTMQQTLDHLYGQIESSLACHLKPKPPICQLSYRFLYQVLREKPPQHVFASLLLGFELAKRDPHIVGINLVQPEDGIIAIRDYRLHMQMIRFLAEQYPEVNISLHAGELIPELVNQEDLSFHIHDAVMIAKAKRIGHGISIRHENDLEQLLNTMRQKNILVEINLSSNAKILGITAQDHPLKFYIKENIPLALSTDDGGILHTTLSQEYQRAYSEYHLNYCTLKQFSRNALTYSFLPGQSLWNKHHALHPACKGLVDHNILKRRCRQFLHRNEKARQQWTLEQRFSVYEDQLK